MKRLIFAILLLSSAAHAQSGDNVLNPAATAKVGPQIVGNTTSQSCDANGVCYIQAGPNASPFPYQQTLKEATPAPMVIFQATAVPTTVPTPQFVNSAALKHSFVDNSTNQEVYVHLNGSITPIARVQPGTVWFRNWGATGSKMSGSIAVTRPGTLPTSGSIAIGGDS